MPRCATPVLASALLATVALPLSASAQAGELTFAPERPSSGQEIEVAYTPPPRLAGEPALRLRARFRTPRDPPYNRTMTTRTAARLASDGEGAFRGDFTLPDSVVYAVFAVEDTSARIVDTREGSFWELMVHGSDGRPLFEALRQRFQDHMGRDLHATLEIARTAVRTHPDRLLGWDLLRATEVWVHGERGAERLEERRDALRSRVLRLDSTLAAWQDLPVDQVAGMRRYAEEYASEETADRWEQRWRRLREERPGHALAVRDSVFALRRQLREEPERLLEELERLWETAAGPAGRRALTQQGFRTARELGEEEPLVRWADRYREYGPGGERRVVALRALLSNEAAREEGIRSTKEELERLSEPPAETRRLGESRAEHRERAARRAADLRAALGEALLAEGRTRAGLEALERAAAVGWDTDRHRSLGEARLDAGERDAALDAFAAVAADPATHTEAADSLRRELGVGPTAWEAAIDRAEREMLGRTLASSRSEDVGAPSALTADGADVRLDELLGEDATVVVFWSRGCPYSRRAMPRIVERAEELGARGVPVLAVTGGAAEAAQKYLREEEGLHPGEGPLTVLFDVEGEMANAIDNWATPKYYVLDGAGRLRFESTLDDLPRHVAALRAEAGEPITRR